MPVVKYPRATEPLWHEWDRKAQKCGLRHTVYAVNGDQYTGEWLDNLKHGKGTQLWKCSRAIYSGDWKFGKRDGYGSHSIFDPVTKEYKKVYTGWWKNDRKCYRGYLPLDLMENTHVRHLLGSLTCTSPVVYIQKFTNQTTSGIKSKEEQQKSETVQHGHGTTLYPRGERYEGEWSGGLRSGWGRMYYQDGSIYDGQWLQDQPHGQGMLRLPNENRYEGGWRDGKKHGHGKFFYMDKGQLLEGIWAADIPKCGILIDFSRDKAPAPTQYPIPKVELADPDGVLAEAQAMFDDSPN